MIELNYDQLTIRFPAIEESLRQRIRAWVDAKVAKATPAQRGHLPATGEDLYRKFSPYLARVEVKVSFQRTLRIPDDGKDYPLPPGLGEFPLRHVDDFAATPAEWKKSGGVMLPMHRTEAMWLSFDSGYPMALRVGAGGVCAVSGQTWSSGLTAKPQNYLVLPSQPWLDGFRVSENVIRQFVAVPLGKGLTVEQQITGQESWGGLQLQAFPMHEDIHWQRTVEPRLRSTWDALVNPLPVRQFLHEDQATYSLRQIHRKTCCEAPAMGLGAGGRMRQEITADRFGVPAWNSMLTSRCYVHLCLAEEWRRLTGEDCPTQPPTAQDYTESGMPWFDFDNGEEPVTGSTPLSSVKSVNDLVVDKTGLDLADNESVTPTFVHLVKPKTDKTVTEF